MAGVLDGIRIVDLCRAGPGQMSTGLLADYGADVISIVEPGFAQRRAPSSANPNSFGRVNRRNKRSILLNMKLPEGKAILYKMIERADALMESNRPGVAEKLGVDYATLKRINPGMVYCSLSGYGQFGPYRHRAGHDLSFEGTGGMLVKGNDGQFAVPPYNQADLNAAMNGALALLMGLLFARRTGRGEYIDVAFSDCAIPVRLGGPLAVGGLDDENLRGAHPCYNIYETKDGKHITLSVREPWFWQRLCQLLGHEEWVPHQRPTGKLREEMFAAFRVIFKSKTQAEWLNILNDNDNQFGPVNETPDEVANDPHNKARQSVVELADPVSKEKVKYLGFILKFAENPATLRFGPNLMGAETAQILDELGYKEADIRRLKDSGVIDLP